MLNEAQKAAIYGDLLNQHTRLHNQINEIKGSDINLKPEQLNEIKKLEQAQLRIMQQINILMNK